MKKKKKEPKTFIQKTHTPQTRRSLTFVKTSIVRTESPGWARKKPSTYQEQPAGDQAKETQGFKRDLDTESGQLGITYPLTPDPPTPPLPRTVYSQ